MTVHHIRTLGSDTNVQNPVQTPTAKPEAQAAGKGLAEALAQGQVWTGKAWQHEHLPVVPTGYPTLDELFEGWPKGALTEILYSQAGIGEMRLLVPALAELSQQERWIMLIAPPFLPNAEVLAQHGVDTSKLLIVRPESVRDLHWTLEECLHGGTCSAVLAWPGSMDLKTIRRLQLAAEAGSTLGLLFRAEHVAQESSAAALRLTLAATAEGTEIKVIKRRGGWPKSPVQMNFGFIANREDVRPASDVIQGPWVQH
ncbi:MAG: translesion DNA synthesis-associated protein ImuA [Natronospirillum sp.]